MYIQGSLKGLDILLTYLIKKFAVFISAPEEILDLMMMPSSVTIVKFQA